MRIKHKFGHGQAGTLASTQDSYLLVYILTSKEECPKDIPQSVTNFSDSYFLKSIIYSILFLQYIFLILSIISYINIISCLSLSLKRLQFRHHYTHHGSLTFTVSSYKGHLLSTLYGHICTSEDDLARTIVILIANYGILDKKCYISRAWCRWKLHRQSGE